MNKKNILVVVFLVILILFFFIVFLNNKNSKESVNISNNNDININNQKQENSIDTQIINKYKEKDYVVNDKNIVLCNQNLNCGYDVLSDCYKNSFFVAYDKKSKNGYIISNFIKKENICNFKITNGVNALDYFDCNIDLSLFNKNIFDEIFNFVNINKYCSKNK